MVNSAFLSKMKKSAVLINTSRGPVVDENDLAEALNNNIISAAYLDVLEYEPMRENTPLRNAKNCVITPHIAWAAAETRKRLLDIVYNNLSGFLNGNIINKVN
jgi:glycerate dehydrogenase